MTNLDSILKSRGITLPTKFCLVEAMVFPVVMYGCASWSIKKVEHWRIDTFELWCWRRLLRVSWTARRSNHFILKEISPLCHWKDWYWSWNSNTLATLYKELTHLKRPWCCKRLRAGREGDDRGWDGWMASPIQWTWVWVISRSWWWTGRPGVLRFIGSQRVRHDWVTELNWTETLSTSASSFCSDVPFSHFELKLQLAFKNLFEQEGRTRCWRYRWTWSISLSTHISGIHLQTQKCVEKTSWEQTGVPDQRNRIYGTMQNSVGWRNWRGNRSISRIGPALSG